MPKKTTKSKPKKKSAKIVQLETIDQVPLSDFTERAYLDYSMYVILDRALPSVADGLKPVQRRIIYAMSELGLINNAKYKKSARTIGDVIGKFHPHGDGACYEAMVHMSQPFSYRYPLVDGQGNWGSPDDPKSFAAMRYTEAKLTKYAQILLSEIGHGTVDYALNFDATLKEPKLLPSRLPNVLLNGATGIAVGMSTDILPHNLTEVVDALLYLIDTPEASVKDIMKFIKAPDFPTEAEIISSKEEIRNIYETGTGMVKARGVYTVEGTDIIITQLPHQVSGAKILEQIANQMRQKKLPMVIDLRDESDHENPTRLVVSLKSSKVDKEEIMGHLFASTDLERNYRMNLNAIDLSGKPKVFNLVDLLKEWLEYRQITVTRRLTHRLEKVEARLNILAGLLIAFLNIDAVIKVIRESDAPKKDLMKKFKLNEKQAEAILEIKLRQLAKLEEIKIKTEQDTLKKEQSELVKILASKQRLKTLIKKELKQDQKDFGDVRRTKLVKRAEAKVLDFKAKIPSDPITVILSKKGWVRQAKGSEVEVDSLNFKAGDELLATGVIAQNENVIFVDSSGRTYAQAAHSLPSSRGHGEPLTVRVTPPPGAHFIGLITQKQNDAVLLLTSLGYGFRVAVSELFSKNKKGKAVMKVSEGATLLPAVAIENKTHIALLSNEGRLLVVPIEEVPELSKGKGNKLMQISVTRFKAKEEYVLAAQALNIKDTLEVRAGKRKLTISGKKELKYYIGKRAERGHKLPKGFAKVTNLSLTKFDF